MRHLHHAKRFTLRRLDLLKDNAMLAMGHSDGDTILDNYYRLMAQISSAEDEHTLSLIPLTDDALLAT